MITKDDFDQWRDNEVTQEVFKGFDNLAKKALQDWIVQSWDHGNCDPLFRADFHARAEVIEDFRAISYEALEEWLDYERNEDPRLKLVTS